MSSPSPIVSRIRFAGLALFLVFGLEWLPSAAYAQYMYLDSDGDGVNTEEDVINSTGTTTIDVYLATDQNGDGSAAVCLQGDDPFTINSYEVILRAVGGTCTWGIPINRMPEFGVSFGSASSGTETYMGIGGAPISPGTYRLMTIAASVLSGAPEIQIVPRAQTLSTRFGTTFGSACLGIRGTNTLELGLDWFDVAGLAPGISAPPNSSPEFAGIQNMSVAAGEQSIQGVTAADPDNQILTISKTAGPVYMALVNTTRERGSATADIYLTPVRAEIGSTTGTLSVSDGEMTSSRAFGISVVAGVDHPTRLDPIETIAVACGRIRTAPLYARDPDGEVLTFRKISGPEFLSVETQDNGPAACRGLLRVAPGICDAGPHQAVITAENGPQSVQVQVAINVTLPRKLPDDTDQSFPVDASPIHDIAVSDFNRDGHADIATLGGTGTITVLLGDGTGTFVNRFTVPNVGYSLRMRSADWNQDGVPDLGTVDFIDNQLSIFVGHGDGSFTKGNVLPIGGQAQDFLSADLDDDGLLDLVVGGSTSSSVGVYLGVGGGSFAPRRDVATSGTAFCVASADMNGDGRLDLAVGTFAHRSVSVHLGLGDGSFQDPVETDVPADPYTISAADLNEDGVPDLVITDYDGALLFALGDGGGGLISGEPTSGFALSPTGALSDLNGDGHLDFVLVTPNQEGATAFLGDGSGAFPTRATMPAPPSIRIALADVNEDAIPDFIMTDSNVVPSVLVRLNTIGAGTAVEARSFVKDSKRTRPGAAGSNSFCALLEPVSASYSNTDVNYSSLTLKSEGTGSASSVTATPTKTILEGDTDGNGVAEISACFSGADMARLFDQVNGRRTVHVNLEGALKDGRRFCSGFDMTVVGAGGPLAATVTPNPLNPSGVLSFRTSRDGYVRVRMFDLNGRLVRVLADVPLAPAGDQEIRIDGRGGHGETLATGAYFYVVETPEGKTRGRVMILK